MSTFNIICRVIGVIVGCAIVYAVARELGDTDHDNKGTK